MPCCGGTQTHVEVTHPQGCGLLPLLSTQHPNQLLLSLTLHLSPTSPRLQTLQRGLPRPASIDKLPGPRAPAELAAMSLRERAEAELNNELAALVQHDNLTYPIPTEAAEGGSSSKKRKKGQQVGSAGWHVRQARISYQ